MDNSLLVSMLGSADFNLPLTAKQIPEWIGGECDDHDMPAYIIDAKGDRIGETYEDLPRAEFFAAAVNFFYAADRTELKHDGAIVPLSAQFWHGAAKKAKDQDEAAFCLGEAWNHLVNHLYALSSTTPAVSIGGQGEGDKVDDFPAKTECIWNTTRRDRRECTCRDCAW